MAELVANGKTGVVRFDSAAVTVRRGGMLVAMRGGSSGEKRIPLSSIVSVQWHDASRMSNGFIKFITSGMGPLTSSLGRHVVTEAMSDPDAVVFTRKNLAEFQQLRQAVEHAIDARNAAGSALAAHAAPSVADELAKLAGLRDAGVVTEEEFNSKKAELLSRM